MNCLIIKTKCELILTEYFKRQVNRYLEESIEDQSNTRRIEDKSYTIQYKPFVLYRTILYCITICIV